MNELHAVDSTVDCVESCAHDRHGAPRAHTGQLTITLTAPGEDLPRVRDALTTTVGNLLSTAKDLIGAEESLDREQRLDLLDRLPEPEELAVRIPPRHGVWMTVSVGVDPLIVPLSPGVRVTEQVVLDDRVTLLGPLLEHEQRPRELLVLTLSEQQADLALLDLTSRELTSVGDPFPLTYPGDHTATQDRAGSRQRRERRRTCSLPRSRAASTPSCWSTVRPSRAT